jgi:hypothetical protein
LGGGTDHCSLFNCVLTGNLSGGSGGAVSASTLYNCTLAGNGAAQGGGGAYQSALVNSILYHNSGDNYDSGTVLSHCCTSPLPTNGVGNITGPPLFMDMAGGDYRLREDSPCIDAGTNLLGLTLMDPDTGALVGCICAPTDILGNSRFIDGNGDGKVAWDIGAYEFNSWKAPRFAVQPQLTADGWRLNVTGAPNKWARLQRSSNLRDWEQIWSGWMGPEGSAQVTDSDQQGVMFYRVVVP